MDKKYKIVFVILLINVLVVLGIILFNSHKNQGYATVMIDNFGKWLYSDQKWSKILSSDLNEYSWKKYDLYADNKFFGNYYLVYNDKWYIFDDNKKVVNWKLGTIALGGNIKSSLDKMSITDINSQEYVYVKNVLDSIGINNQEIDKIGFKKKYKFDLDKDNVEDVIYAVSNAQMQGKYSQKKNYTILFLRKNNKNVILYQHVENKYNTYGGCIPDINAITLGKEKISKVIVNCSYYSDSSVYSGIYDYNKKENMFNRLASASFK